MRALKDSVSELATFQPFCVSLRVLCSLGTKRSETQRQM